MKREATRRMHQKMRYLQYLCRTAPCEDGSTVLYYTAKYHLANLMIVGAAYFFRG